MPWELVSELHVALPGELLRFRFMLDQFRAIYLVRAGAALIFRRAPPIQTDTPTKFAAHVIPTPSSFVARPATGVNMPQWVAAANIVAKIFGSTARMRELRLQLWMSGVMELAFGGWQIQVFVRRFFARAMAMGAMRMQRLK
jgi:hypothetical protein